MNAVSNTTGSTERRSSPSVFCCNGLRCGWPDSVGAATSVIVVDTTDGCDDGVRTRVVDAVAETVSHRSCMLQP